MRIGIDIRELEKGKRTGIGRVISGFLNYVSENDTTNEYVLFGNQNTEIQMDWKIRIVREGITFIWDQVKLPLALKREKIQLFFSPYFKAPIFAPCPFITMISDLTPLWVTAEYSPRSFLKTEFIKAKALSYYYAFWGRLCAKFAQKVITLSNYSRQELLKTLHIDRSKIIIVYPPVMMTPPVVMATSIDDIFFRSMSDKKDTLGHSEQREESNRFFSSPSLRSGWRFRMTGREFILWVGVMRPSKNLPRLIEAYKMLPNEIKEKYALVIAGKKNEYFIVLKNLVERLELGDKVLFPGLISDDDLPALYHSASLFVFPSLYEGFGIPPLEAMACGTPVVASNTTSLPEVLGDAGILVNPLDSKGLSEAMYEALTNMELRNRMIEKGKMQAKQFSVESMSQKLLSVLG